MLDLQLFLNSLQFLLFSFDPQMNKNEQNEITYTIFLSTTC